MAQALKRQLAVAPARLRRRVDPACLPATTADIPPFAETSGQPYALDALTSGLELRSPGYHLFLVSPPGSDHSSAIYDVLSRSLPDRPAPSDWVYIYNVARADRPLALRLPRGRGRAFASALDNFLEAAQRELTHVFASEDYIHRQRKALAGLQQRHNELFEQIQSEACDQGFALEQTSAGIVTIPLLAGKPLSPRAFRLLPVWQQEEMEQHDDALQERIAETLRGQRQLQTEMAERVRQLKRDVVLFTVGPLLDELRTAYADLPEVLTYLAQVRHDLPAHLDKVWRAENEERWQISADVPAAPLREEHLARYRVNVFVDNQASHRAPLISERAPTCAHLLGCIDSHSTSGAPLTDLGQIKAGALQRANGGFLILQALDLLTIPFAWNALKRALISGEVVIEHPGEPTSALPTARLQPAPIPLDVKVLLLGPPAAYALLSQLDPDFQELFKVRIDLAADMQWNDEYPGHYAAFISQCVREQGLRHLSRAALAQMLEEGTRLREDQCPCSSCRRVLTSVLAEANDRAGKAEHDLVEGSDMQQAIARQKYQLVEKRLREVTGEASTPIDTTGACKGQINGVTVRDTAAYTSGLPVRITARVAPGRGTVQRIEREITPTGPIHSKGFFMLSAYLAGQYTRRTSLALAATITCEQPYDEVEGDAAAASELYALLSALSELPLQQGIAATGSVNQHGEVQAIAGVTTKIESFFASCRTRGLTGEQGVIIPAANVPNLMLDEEVIDAVHAGQFHIWAVRTIDEGLELLTGQPAGQRGPDGQYPQGSVHCLVEQRLQVYARHRAQSGSVHSKAQAQMGTPIS
jgi:predicted ATP-dependent protease